jgi:hypothetical protein
MIRQILEEIATPGSIYDEILDNILRPNLLHMKQELISEIAISFLEKEEKVNEVIQQNYFIYYFVRTVTNNVRSNTSPFYRNNIVKERFLFDNVEIIDEDQIESKIEKEEKYQKIDRAYVKIPKTFFQEFVWHEYYSKGKTYRQIGEENEMSYSIIFYELKKIKDQLFDSIK